MFPSLRLLLYGAGLLCFCSLGAQAQTWREHQFAGYSAFDSGDLASAVERLEAALAGTSENYGEARERGAILENLATAYFAVGRHEDARDAIERWDELLARSAGEAWVPHQRNFRTLLADFMTDKPGKAERKAGLPSGGSPHATKASGTPGDYGIHLVSLAAGNDVESSWHKLSAAYPSQLTGRALVVKPVDLGDQGNFSRILAAPFSDLADAQSACSELQALGQYCTALPLN